MKTKVIYNVPTIESHTPWSLVYNFGNTYDFHFVLKYFVREHNFFSYYLNTIEFQFVLRTHQKDVENGIDKIGRVEPINLT